MASIRGAVIAGFAARRAVELAVFAKPYVDLTLASAAIFLANALLFGHVTLQAKIFLLGSGSGGHGETLALVGEVAKVPEVTRR
jgi:hypothetical protein